MRNRTKSLFLRPALLLAFMLLATGCFYKLLDAITGTGTANDMYEDLTNAPEEDLEAVDLGLPSGVLWGSKNLLSSRKWDLGNGYAWGEILEEGAASKYNDKKYVLDKDDDIATTTLGGEWRMPTRWEFEELIEYCKWESHTVIVDSSKQKVKGFIISSKTNSNSIFIPFYRWWNNIAPIGKASYWTSCASQGDFATSFRGDRAFGKDLRNSWLHVRPIKARRAPIKSFSIRDANLELVPGEKHKVILDFIPGDALDKHVVWKIDFKGAASFKGTIASIDDSNTITALYPGQGQLIAFSSSSGLCSTVELKVSDYVVPELIDLGLPSGTLWSDRFLGAIKPEDEGLLFAWGETAPKIECSYQNYTGSVGYENGVINTEKLSPEQDAATVILGEGWRTPSSEDFEELFGNCDIRFSKPDKRLIIKSKSNGKELHFPSSKYSWTSTASQIGAITHSADGEGRLEVYDTEYYLGNYIWPVYKKE